MILHIHQTSADASRALAERILQIARNTPGLVNIALSGGNTPAQLFRMWASEYGDCTPWERIRFFWVDERCVPPEDAESNYGMTKRNLLDLAPIPPENVFRIHGENDPDSEAIRYAEQAGRLIPSAVFDIVLLGIGEDGHTASIFPGQETLLTAAHMYAVGVHPTSGQRRVTLTGQPLIKASCLCFLAAGRSKRNVLAELSALSGSGPAIWVARNALHPVELFIDAEAGALLRDQPNL